MARKASWTRWWAAIPENIRNPAQPWHPDRAVMHLRLEACLVRMFIGRPFLLRKETPAPADGQPRALESHDLHPADRDDLIGDCIQAAQEALEICRRLRDQGPGLARASYLEYSACRAALLVLIAYSVQSLSDTLRQPMREGLALLREMSAAGDSARSEVSFLEALERSLARLQTVTQRPEMSSQPAPLVSDYDTFRHWGSQGKKPPETGPSGSPDAADWPNPLVEMDQMSTFDASLDLSIFGGTNLSPSATWPIRTETQVLEEFLAGSTLDPIWNHVDLP